MMSNRIKKILMTAGALACSAHGVFAQSGCKEALAQNLVCESANAFADKVIKSRHLIAVTVVQNVSSGALVLFAASEPSTLDVSTPVLPLSLSKVFLAASWWDHDEPDLSFENLNGTEDAENPAYRRWVNPHEMIVGGSDSAGKQMAIALRQRIGTEAVLADLHRYGFDRKNASFWADVDCQWKSRLTPPPADASLNDLDDDEWGSALSIGESRLRTSALQISRFFQAVGNNGLECSPIALRMPDVSRPAMKSPCLAPKRILDETTAKRLMDAMVDTVKRGTASQLSGKLTDTGWSIGGKTGTGGVTGAPLNEQDGWFAGLIFDGKRKARFSVATFVRHGGLGAGYAGEISTELARFLAVESAPFF